jgi:phosphoribosylpyrophosphate synthetase
MTELSPIPLIDIVQSDSYKQLYEGLRSQTNPVTWRTMSVKIGKLIGVKDPEHEDPSPQLFDQTKTLTEVLVEDTPLEPLVPEILDAIGFDQAQNLPTPNLDALLINARHQPDELLYSLAKFIRDKEKSIAVVNPVGHYNDQETRIVGPARMFRDMDKVVFLASTQAQRGGSWEVLIKTLRLLRNPAFTSRIQDKVHIVIPMWGGSRGHRPGQKMRMGYEVLEAQASSKLLALSVEDIWKNVAEEIDGHLPDVGIHTIDLHNPPSVSRVLRPFRIDFENHSPSTALASEILETRANQKLDHLTFKFIACDEGANARTDSLVQKTLIKTPGECYYDVIYINKTRKTAGIVSDAKIAKVVRWHKDETGIITQHEIDKDFIKNDEFIAVLSDDMLDTGNSLRIDKQKVFETFTRVSKWWFIASHPVLSQEENNLSGLGIDFYFLGNTLLVDPNILKGIKKDVDLASTLATGILGLVP